jgi:integrase
VNKFHADRAIRRVGQLPLSKITPEVLDREQQYLLAHGKRTTLAGEPLSPKSVKETFTLIKAAFRQAKRWNRISIDAAADLQVPTVKRRHVEVLQKHELEEILNLFAGTREYALLVFTAGSGCRRGEALALQVTDLNLTTGEVSISKSLETTSAGIRVKSTKSGKPRSLELPDWALPIVREHLAMLSQERKLLGADYEHNGLLFPQRNGAYYRPDEIGSHINDMLRRHGMRSTLHGLRHFNASYLLSEKVPLPIVSERLGHANPAITLAIYSHVMKADHSAAAKTLSEGLKNVLPTAKRSLRPVLVTRSDTEGEKTGTES